MAAYARVRDFVWTHFSGHRPGCITLIGRSVEGMEKAISYYIGSGAENEWHVEVASAWEEYDFNKKELMKKSSKISFSSVKRVGVGESGFGKNELIPARVTVPAASYHLQFYGTDGKLEAEL